MSPGPHVDVGGDVAALHEILETHAVGLAALVGAVDAGLVAVGEIREAADRDHHVEQRQVPCETAGSAAWRLRR